MKVILLKDIADLGKAGELKEVKDGYARNYLIPNGLAKPATDSEIKKMEYQKLLKVQREDAVRKKSEEIMKALQRVVHRISAKSGGGGKLFGAITAANLAEAISKQTGLEIDKKWVNLEKPIKELGMYDVEFRLPGGIRGIVKVEIVTEEKG